MTLNQIKALIKESEETGRPIQIQVAQGGEWAEIKGSDTLVFALSDKYYRVAPPEPPKPREWWVMPNLLVSAGVCKLGPDAMKAMGYVLTREVTEDPKS